MSNGRFHFLGRFAGQRDQGKRERIARAAASTEIAPLRAQLSTVGAEFAAAQATNEALHQQLVSVGAELAAARAEIASLRLQLSAVGEELTVTRRRNEGLQSLVDGVAEGGEAPASARSSPSVLFNALPKSASTYCSEVLRRRAHLAETSIAIGYFPTDMISRRRLAGFARGGCIAHHHLDASAPNLLMLRGQPIRLVLHLRDPRQAILSWFHHLRTGGGTADDSLTEAPIPRSWLDLGGEAQIDWLIDHHLPVFVRWIESWMRAVDRDEAKLLVTTFEDFVRDPGAFFAAIARYCELDAALAAGELPDPASEYLFQFRAGMIDEWRSVFTAAQIERVRHIVPPALLERFRWPPT